MHLIVILRLPIINSGKVNLHLAKVRKSCTIHHGCVRKREDEERRGAGVKRERRREKKRLKREKMKERERKKKERKKDREIDRKKEKKKER